MLWLVAILIFILFLYYNQREGYEDYDETSCLTLAQQNQDNIASLQKDVDTLLALQSQVQTVQNSTCYRGVNLK